MKTTPLPPTREDPSLVAAAKVTTEATAKIASIRANRDLSDLAKARQIDAAYTAVMTERARLRSRSCRSVRASPRTPAPPTKRSCRPRSEPTWRRPERPARMGCGRCSPTPSASATS